MEDYKRSWEHKEQCPRIGVGKGIRWESLVGFCDRALIGKLEHRWCFAEMLWGCNKFWRVLWIFHLGSGYQVRKESKGRYRSIEEGSGLPQGHAFWFSGLPSLSQISRDWVWLLSGETKELIHTQFHSLTPSCRPHSWNLALKQVLLLCPGSN